MTTLAAISNELEELVGASSPSVVSVEHRRGHGTGFVLAQDGNVLTNSHGVAGAERPRVSFADGSPLKTVDDLSRAMVLNNGAELTIGLWRKDRRQSFATTPTAAT